jgi:predicted DNA-binding antitoxin AbrB/MazE fold protein
MRGSDDDSGGDMQTIMATFENGVLKPTQPLNLPDHAQVRITIEPVGADLQKEEKLAALESLWQISRIHSEQYLTRDELNERR